MVCPYDFPPVDNSGFSDMKESDLDSLQKILIRFVKFFRSIGSQSIGQMPPDLKCFIPNSYWRPPHILSYDKPVHVQSLVMVATRPISNGEELFVNYRFNPTMDLPDWYHHVDLDEDRRRWSG